MAVWLDGWMVEWLDGWMAGWLDGWMVGWLDGWMVGWLGGWVAGCALIPAVPDLRRPSRRPYDSPMPRATTRPMTRRPPRTRGGVRPHGAQREELSGPTTSKSLLFWGLDHTTAPASFHQRLCRPFLGVFLVMLLCYWGFAAPYAPRHSPAFVLSGVVSALLIFYFISPALLCRGFRPPRRPSTSHSSSI